MRKFLLVAFAASAMVVAALPSASLARAPRTVTAAVTCPPGSNDSQYCEHQCPDNVTALTNTANAAAAAALSAAGGLSGRSTSLSFSFGATACTHLTVELRFGVPHDGKLVWVTVGAIHLVPTKAGTTFRGTISINSYGQAILARYNSGHDHLNVMVVATASSKTKRVTKSVSGKIAP